MPTLTCTGISATSMAGLMNVIARAMFHAVDLPVLMFTAGASIYGPAVHINTGKSPAWNIARAITFSRPAMEVAEIPVHVNVGMGVGGVPTCVYPPADATSRASKAFVEILKIDGY